MTMLLKFILFSLAAYLGIIAFMYLFQRRLLYFPDRNMKKPIDYGCGQINIINLTTKDNIIITAWHHPASAKKETILYFHGNKGHLADRSEKLCAFVKNGYGLLGVSYRGYGTSQGKPFEQGFYEDGRAAMEYLLKNGIDLKDIVIYGESLGTGVATHIATEYPARALVLEAPYTSVIGRAAEIYWFIPVRKLLREHFDSIGKIANVKIPVLILHGELDQTIPASHGRKLLAAVTGTKKGVFFPTIGHVDFDPNEIVKNIDEFLKSS